HATFALQSGSGDPARLLRLSFRGADVNAVAESEERLPGSSNYITGTDPAKWRTGVPQYGRVRYHNIYPGIYIAFCGDQVQLEYEFILAAGADPARVRLSFEGADRLRIAEGDLLLDVGGSEIRQLRPKLYQVIEDIRTKIAGEYELAKSPGEVRVRVGGYDRRRGLGFDPGGKYAAFLGGAANGMQEASALWGGGCGLSV